MRLLVIVGFAIVCLSLAAVPAARAFDVLMGDSWDSIPLQDILDAEYGFGAVDVATDYAGYYGEADPPYWVDSMVDGIIIREVAGYQNTNIFGWYRENFTMPVIDGNQDGVIFTGPMVAGQTATVVFPNGVTQFGFYLNPNGTGDSNNAPEPELFFTNRFYNDLGPDGSGAIHAPFDGDPQCLIFDISHLPGKMNTYVLAWEDLDSGSTISPTSLPGTTDNDFNDLVVEITAFSPVPNEGQSWGQVKALFGQ